MLKKEVKLQKGDIFTIPIDDNRIGYGQIIETREHDFLIVVFDYSESDDNTTDLSAVVKSRKILMGNTLDAKFFNGDWRIVGSVTDNLKEIPLPTYKIGLPGSLQAVSYYGNIVSTADVELDDLEYELVSAPIRFEKALQAHFGKGEWDERDNEILYK